MFKRHVFTCPDVIYLRNRQKKINIATMAVQIVFWGGLLGWGYVEDRKTRSTIDPIAE